MIGKKLKKQKNTKTDLLLKNDDLNRFEWKEKRIWGITGCQLISKSLEKIKKFWFNGGMLYVYHVYLAEKNVKFDCKFSLIHTTALRQST